VGDDGVTDTTKAGLTVTVTVSVLVQPFKSVPVTVYVVVPGGVDVTDEPVVALSPVEGPQVYDDAPPAVSTTFPPGQRPAEGGVTVTEGNGFTVTLTVAVLIHPPVVPVTVYVVVVPGVAVTEAPVVALKPVPGLHVYVVAPPALIVVELPAHKVGVIAEAVTVGVGFTVRVTVAVLVHPAVVPVTV
jgi:hypothetical protein